MDKPIRLLIADDHEIVRKGLRTLIETEPDLALVGEAEDGLEAVAGARALQPDVILLDLVMPRQGGLETIRQIKDDKVFPAIKAGALGYLLKDSRPPQLLEAIRQVYRGRSSLHPTIARKLIQEMNQSPDLPPTKEPLTPRELEVLKLVARGLTNQEIAAELVITERTVTTHVSNILSKLHLANRTQAALYAIREGLVDPHQGPAT